MGLIPTTSVPSLGGEVNQTSSTASTEFHQIADKLIRIAENYSDYETSATFEAHKAGGEG